MEARMTDNGIVIRSRQRERADMTCREGDRKGSNGGGGVYDV
jgi:hypothetical protein